MAAGWSPVGSKGETTSSRAPSPSTPNRLSSAPKRWCAVFEDMGAPFKAKAATALYDRRLSYPCSPGGERRSAASTNAPRIEAGR